MGKGAKGQAHELRSPGEEKPEGESVVGAPSVFSFSVTSASAPPALRSPLLAVDAAVAPMDEPIASPADLGMGKAPSDTLAIAPAAAEEAPAAADGLAAGAYTHLAAATIDAKGPGPLAIGMGKGPPASNGLPALAMPAAAEEEALAAADDMAAGASTDTESSKKSGRSRSRRTALRLHTYTIAPKPKRSRSRSSSF